MPTGDLQFNSDQQNEFGPPAQTRQQGTSLTDKLIQWGLASNAQQAQYVLIALGVIALIVAFFLMRGGGGGVPPPPIT